MHKGSYDCRRIRDGAGNEELTEIGMFSWRRDLHGKISGIAIALPNKDGLPDPNWIPVNLGEPVKEEGRDDWGWDGNEDKPTLKPSILFKTDHWHGYLKAGRLENCEA